MATARTKKMSVPIEPKPLFADVEEVKEFAQGLPDKFLECREMNHIWKAWTGQYIEGGILRILRCQRCRSERHQEISLSGTVLRSWYKHAEGYLHEGMGRIAGDGRDALRVESLTRFMTKVAAKSDNEEPKTKVPQPRKATTTRRKTKAA